MKKIVLTFIILLFTTIVLYSETSLKYSVLETTNNISFSLHKNENSYFIEHPENEDNNRQEATFSKGMRNLAIIFLIFGIFKVSSRRKNVKLNILFNSN